MKKLVLIVVLLLFSFLNIYAQVEPTDTDGDGYRNISTLEHLRWIGLNSNSWSDDFELDNDIDASDTENWNGGEGWIPIGNNVIKFEGNFNGNGFEIDGLFINKPLTDYIGFFGFTNNAEISNLGITNATITGNLRVAGVIGYNSSSTITKCYCTGSINGTSNLGAIAGTNQGSTIQECFGTASIDGFSRIGGLVGYNGSSSNINKCYSTGNVNSTNQTVGGLAGTNINGSIISNSYSTGVVSGISDVGGFLGSNSATVTNCFWDTETSGQANSDGGTGKTTAEMKTQSTFTDAGWDFVDFWSIYASLNVSYPILHNNFNETIPVEPTDTDGDGYLNISTLSHLRWISENTSSWSDNLELDNDIDAAETENWNVGDHDNDSNTPDSAMGWKPIGNETVKFTGKFNGNGHEIEGIYINRLSERYVGFFGYTSFINTDIETISNLGLINNFCRGGSLLSFSHSGGLIGKNENGIINKCYATGSSSAFAGDFANASYCGGLIGRNENGKIKECYSTATSASNTTPLNCNSYSGGLIGENSGEITNCYSTGNSTSTTNEWGAFSYSGGLIGNNSGKINNCYSTGSSNSTIDSRDADSFSGGLIGSNSAEITNCNSTATSTSTTQNRMSNATSGGLIGSNSGKIINCYSTGNSSSFAPSNNSSSYAQSGGLIGQSNNGTYNNCFSTGSSLASILTQSSNADSGGLIGLLVRGDINNCYASSSSEATSTNFASDSYSGGLIGRNLYEVSISNCYSRGLVEASSNNDIFIGGLIGVKENNTTIENSFWDTETSGQANSDGGTGKTTAEMKTQSTFTNWDFNDIWNIDPAENDGYPFLRPETTVDLNIALTTGWNMISSNVVPTDLAMETVFANISGNVLIVKNGNGKIYVPSFNINTIGDWNILEGYQVYATSNVDLVIQGNQVDPQNTPNVLSVGWNMVSYSRSTEMNAELALTSLTDDDNLLIAKDGNGKIYVPSFNINTIGNLKPTEGYQMYITTEDSLLYPAE